MKSLGLASMLSSSILGTTRDLAEAPLDPNERPPGYELITISAMTASVGMILGQMYSERLESLVAALFHESWLDLANRHVLECGLRADWVLQPDRSPPRELHLLHLVGEILAQETSAPAVGAEFLRSQELDHIPDAELLIGKLVEILRWSVGFGALYPARATEMTTKHGWQKDLQATTDNLVTLLVDLCRSVDPELAVALSEPKAVSSGEKTSSFGDAFLDEVAERELVWPGHADLVWSMPADTRWATFGLRATLQLHEMSEIDVLRVRRYLLNLAQKEVDWRSEYQFSSQVRRRSHPEWDDAPSLTVVSPVSAGNESILKAENPKRLSLALLAIEESLSEGNIDEAAKRMGNLGQTYRDLGDTDTSLVYSRRAVELFEQVGDKQSLALELVLQANTLMRAMDIESAMSVRLRGLRIADELGDPTFVAMNTFGLWPVLSALGKHNEARIALRYAALLYATAGNTQFWQDAVDSVEQGKLKGEFEDSPFENGLDEVFFAGPSRDKLATAARAYPPLLTPEAFQALGAANETTVGVQVLIQAIKKQVGILRDIAQSN